MDTRGAAPARLRALSLTGLVLTLAATLHGGPVRAAGEASGPPAPAATGAAPAFTLEITAPPALASLLAQHLSLARYRDFDDLEDGELDRLLQAASREARDLLATQGYFTPAVDLTRLAPAQPGAPRRVRLTVNPGPLARVQRVALTLSGPEANSPEAQALAERLRREWALPEGRVFTQVAWDAAKARALRTLAASPFAAARLAQAQAEVDPEQARVTLALRYDTGPRYRLGPLRLRGAQRYGEDLPRRLAALVPGHDHEAGELALAQQRLVDSGFYDAAYLSLDLAGDPAAAPVDVELREAPLQKLVLGVGASTDSGARASWLHTHHRMPGLGWRAVSRVSLDRDLRVAGVELLGPPDERLWRRLVSAQVQREQSASLAVASEQLRVGQTQGGTAIERQLFLQLDRARARGDASTRAAADALSANALSAQLAWTRRDFDNLPFPSDGHGLSAELGAGVTLGGTRVPYLRTRLRWLGYWPLARTAGGDVPSAAGGGRMAARVDLGAVSARRDATLPATQLFLAGGDASVRGYALNAIGVDLAGGGTTAGRYRAVASVELQRPIRTGGRTGEWEWAVFADAGAVADRPSALRARVGLGAGLRWRSPVGPLQIDLAQAQDSGRWRLHLNVGFSF